MVCDNEQGRMRQPCQIPRVARECAELHRAIPSYQGCTDLIVVYKTGLYVGRVRLAAPTRMLDQVIPLRLKPSAFQYLRRASVTVFWTGYRSFHVPVASLVKTWSLEHLDTTHASHIIVRHHSALLVKLMLTLFQSSPCCQWCSRQKSLHQPH